MHGYKISSAVLNSSILKKEVSLVATFVQLCSDLVKSPFSHRAIVRAEWIRNPQCDCPILYTVRNYVSSSGRLIAAAVAAAPVVATPSRAAMRLLLPWRLPMLLLLRMLLWLPLPWLPLLWLLLLPYLLLFPCLLLQWLLLRGGCSHDIFFPWLLLLWWPLPWLLHYQ